MKTKTEGNSISLDLMVNVVVGGTQDGHHLHLRVLQCPAVLGHLQSLPLGLEGLKKVQVIVSFIFIIKTISFTFQTKTKSETPRTCLSIQVLKKNHEKFNVLSDVKDLGLGTLYGLHNRKNY
jgi:hypothetical protein